MGIKGYGPWDVRLLSDLLRVMSSDDLVFRTEVLLLMDNRIEEMEQTSWTYVIVAAPNQREDG